MQVYNLISVYQTQEMLNKVGQTILPEYNLLKKHEATSLHKFCNLMRKHGCKMEHFNGYYVGYTIKQLGKEFDLLRFGDNYIINIELKREQTEEKVLSQMRKNYYYLKFLGKQIKQFTCLDSGKIYEYQMHDDTIISVDEKCVSECIKEHQYNSSVNPDDVFVPSNYLISPFNSPQRFIKNEYFLTQAQQNIKNEAIAFLEKNQKSVYCISGNAGTGKTLLIYDIAKEYLENHKTATIIHCGILNGGQETLNLLHKWKIFAIREIHKDSIDKKVSASDVIIVDESQRIRDHQLKLILDKAKELAIPVIFSYDKKQYLHTCEKKDLYEYVLSNYPEFVLGQGTLTNKIRTNKELASFVKNMFDIGSSNDHLNYDSVSVEYIDNIEDLREYTKLLKQDEWMVATYTVSQYSQDSNYEISDISQKTAHGVIGQEFSKVVAIMNSSFGYNDKNQLVERKNYYSSYGMLYQIVTRVVNELKIIVYKNPDVYLKLLEIKSMGSK